MTRHLENPLPLPPLNRDFTCIVTGCTNGIGREIARQLVEAGAHVVMAVWKTRSANELIKKWQYDWSGKNNPLNIEIHHVGFVDPEDMNVLTGKRKYTNLMGYSSSKLEQVRPVAEDEMFKVIRTGKHKTKQWKRMLTKVTFVGQGFTRKPPKYERFIHRTPIWSNKF